MELEEETSIYERAILKWGEELQVDMLIEEMAELTQALIKARRHNQLTSISVLEEIADVEICLSQLKMMCAIHRDIDMPYLNNYNDYDSIEEIISEYKDAKLKRLSDRLK